ncbi:MAG TPA: amino acid adenylation domain-containing protein, partial [Longimicrobium sp.]|nr:amino acid adenylation domain-containing protein [Longimicrobium sp.]
LPVQYADYAAWQRRWMDGEPVQVIVPAESGFRLIEHDLSGHPHAGEELERLIVEEGDAPFDLERGPLVRGRLVRLAKDDHLLLVTMHHIVSDGWSTGVLLDELRALYGAFLRGADDPLPPLPVQYADYAAWQRRWMDGEVLEAQAAYWEQALSGAPELLELPTDRPRPARQDHAGGSVDLALDAELTAALRELGRRHGATLFMTILAGWAAVVGRLSGQRDVVVGTPAANRARREVEGLIGFFVNTLALRVDLAGAPTVVELLERVKARVVDAQQHQDIPFEQVVERVQPARSLAHTPLFQVMFAWQNAARELALPGLEPAAVEGGSRGTAKFDLTLSLQEVDGRIEGGLEYATALFDHATAQRYAGYLLCVLREMAADADRPVDALELLSEAERAQVVEGWNATDAAYPAHLCIHHPFEAQVERAPDAVAVTFDDDALTYAELNARANRLAHHLAALGVGPDVRVGLCLERGAEMVVALLATLKAGGAYVPLDPDAPQDRLRAMLEDSAPAVLLTQAALAGHFDHISIPVLSLDADAVEWADRPSSNPVVEGLTPDHLAYVIYTSGSTGTPKGVMNAHRGVVNRLDWMERASRLGPDEAVLQKTPYTFDVSVWEFFWPLMVGARLVMARPGGHRDPLYLVETIRRESITTLHFVPSMLRAFLDAEGVEACASLRRVVCSGEALPAALVRRFHERLPSAELYNLYGPTEAAVDVTAWRCGADAGDVVPIGWPMANVRIYLLDGRMAPVPAGVAGELYIGGIQVARGYLRRAALTAERFVPDPFAVEPGARLYRTGDLARWTEFTHALTHSRTHALEYLGRNDFQVKVRGFRIEPGEIEARLVEHPSVREAVVLARADASGDTRLIAYVVGDDADAEVLRAHLAARLPEYMVPGAFVRLDALPLTSSGKLDRKALPAPDGDAFARQGYEAPVGEAEQALAEVWAEVLGVERVGRHDNFFHLGGHSLLVVKVVERMRRRGLHVEMGALFATPTPAGVAAAAGGESAAVEVPANRIPAACARITPAMLPLVELSQAEIDGIVSAVPGGAPNVQDVYPLAPLQEGFLFHHLVTAEGDPFLMAGLSGFDGREALDAHLAALQQVIDRHDVLRTAVAWDGLREPVQVVWRQARLPVVEVELDAADGDAAKQLYEMVGPRRQRMDVRSAPLMRTCIAREPETGRWLLLLLIHHLVSDHATWAVLRDEVRAHLEGRADQLLAPLPFRDYVAQARLSVARDSHEAYFRALLGDVAEPTAPFGLLDARGDGSGIGEARLAVDAALAARLRERARALGVSAAAVCHVAWAAVLARTSGRDDVVFGTVLFGRMLAGEGAGRVLGPFINTLPVRVRVGDEGAEASVRAAHRQLTELLRHEHASLALAQRCSGVESPAPLFTALLNYRHGAAAAEAHYAEERTNYPLALSVDDRGEALGLVAQAPASVGAERVCALMHRALESLVEALEAAPGREVAALDVLP